MADNVYDAIVIGSGISGGWAAKELTEKGLKVLLLAFAANPQASRNGAFAGSKKGSDKQNFGVLENRFREQRGKVYNDRQQFGRHSQHTNSFLGRKFCSLLSLPLFFQRANG